eukprot:3996069-Amphidinium_carterae.1
MHLLQKVYLLDNFCVSITGISPTTRLLAAKFKRKENTEMELGNVKASNYLSGTGPDPFKDGLLPKALADVRDVRGKWKH